MCNARSATLWIAMCLIPLAAGCGGKGQNDNPPPDQMTGGPDRKEVASATDSEWVLTELRGPGAPAVVVGEAQTRPRVLLDAREKRVTGSTGVNQMTGAYELSGDALRFGPMATTRRAGPPELMKQETAFLEVLRNTATAHVSGPTLYLFDHAGQELARFQANSPESGAKP